MNTQVKQSGFTIVELLIVIVVIAILAAITILSYNGITERTEIAILQENLRNISKQIELDKVERGTYATNLNDIKGTAPFQNGTYSYTYESDSLTYCIEGKKISKPNLVFYINTKTGVLSPEKGNCGGVAVTDIQTRQLNISSPNDYYVSGDLTKILAPSGYSLYYSTNTGASWTDILYDGPMSTEFGQNLDNPDPVYGQYDVGGGALSSNGNRSWITLNYNHSGSHPTSTFCARKLQQSGSNWAYVSTPNCNTTRSQYGGNVVVSDNGMKIALVDSGAARVNLSSDGGSTWDLKNICGCGGGTLQTVKMTPDGATLIAHHSNNLAISKDGGETWTTQLAPYDNSAWGQSALAISDDGQTIAYAGMNYAKTASVAISRDGGETWAERMSNPKLFWISINTSSSGKNMIGIAKTGSFYATNSALYASNNYGETWKKLDELGEAPWSHAFISKDGTKAMAIKPGADYMPALQYWSMQ